MASSCQPKRRTVARQGAMKSKAVLGVALPAFFIVVAIIYFGQTGSFGGQQISAEVAIPSNAFLTPANWNGGYVYDDKFFTPNQITIKTGQAIRWTNKDSTPHTVTSVKIPNGAQAFDTDILDSAKQAVLSFKVPGEYEYYCKIHPFMAGKIQALP